MGPRDVSGIWIATQSNGWSTDFIITQNGGTLSGDATANHFGGGAQQLQGMEFDGTVTDTSFVCSVTWSNGSRGRYEGTFGLDERLTGVTFDVVDPNHSATWVASRLFPPPAS